MRILAETSIGLVVDIQERLFPHIADRQPLLDRTRLLIRGLQVLGLPMLVTQQYTRGLGPTIPEIQELFTGFSALEKRSFSCVDDAAIAASLKSTGRKFVLIAGIETHVCILQTALDLKAAGYQPVVVTDCVSSRSLADKDTALRRLASEGAILTGSESLLFELLRTSESPKFKEISSLVK
ncbi:MAG: hydrolase [Spirochaetia bacterium]|nr:hydrolase [Spirochaetia bacterium]